MFCPTRHPMTLTANNDDDDDDEYGTGWYCDLCLMNELPSCARLCCVICSYDLCESCASILAEAAGSPPKTKFRLRAHTIRQSRRIFGVNILLVTLNVSLVFSRVTKCFVDHINNTSDQNAVSCQTESWWACAVWTGCKTRFAPWICRIIASRPLCRKCNRCTISKCWRFVVVQSRVVDFRR